ncbi:MAG: M1 family metallopeptidase, partial [Candidatus Kapaibacterium sp.]
YGEHDREHDSTSKIGPRGIQIAKFEVGGTPARYEIDNTILHVVLDNPILPGGISKVHFVWTALLPHFGTRTTWGWHDTTARNFATAQWYPQVCVYDNHGWHPDQYIGMGEFYTDYGAFDVSLTLPTRFSTVMTTGWLENPTDVLSDAVREHLDFAKAHPDSVVHIADNSDYRYQPITASEPMRTWNFHADSVRDFAWSADEAYIWDAVFDGGVMHHAVYWNRSREFWSREAAKIVLITEQTNSAFAGKYIYPNMILSETYEGGMEYPGIVFVGPSENESTYHWQYNTMMHELGHEWYPMMMGSNETDYGYMDEGFNTFITTFVQERYFGRWNNSYGPGLGFNDDERTSNYRGALMQQLVGNQEPSKQKADTYLSYRDYAEASYPHPASVFFMLRYTMGDNAFEDFMHLYYQRWRFKHPYPDDLLNAAEDIERVEGDTNRVRARGDLRWFFNEWFEQTWQLDYAIGDFDVDGNTATVTIDKRQRAVMPLDLVFTFEDGSTERKWIPVDDWLRTMSKERTYTYAFDKKPVKVELNPTLELLDVNRLNNVWPHPPVQVSLVPKIYGDVKPIDSYALRSSPYIAPLAADFSHGWLAGWTLLGSYLDRTHRIAIGPRLGFPHESSTTVGGAFQYHSVFDAFSPFSDIDLLLAQSDSNAFYGFRYSHIINAPGTTNPVHILEAGYDLSGNVWNKWSGAQPPLNRGYFGYTFHDRFGFNMVTLAGEGEDGLGDPRTTYTKIAGMLNDRIDITDDWNAFIRLFGGS